MIISWLRHKFSERSSAAALQADEVAALRTAFQTRYHHFKRLLTANNKALEIMADIERALAGDHVFSMTFVRSRCTAVSVNVYQMITLLDQLAPGRYAPLSAGFRRIQQDIDSLLQAVAPEKDTPLVLPFSTISTADTDQVGGKIAQLGHLRSRISARVPDGFAVTAAGYHRFMTHNDLHTEIDRLLQTVTADDMAQLHGVSAAIRQKVIKGDVPDDLAAAIRGAYLELVARASPQVRTAMRSSALGEDLSGQSFAGLYLSRLNVCSDDILQVYKEIVASKYSVAPMAYRLQRGLKDEDLPMCVGCMEMVDARAGGVMYTRHPIIPGVDHITINAVFGLPKAVVDGSGAADEIIMTRGNPPTIVTVSIPRKSHAYTCDRVDGIRRIALTAAAGERAVLTDAQARRLALTGLELERLAGAPQDIEWAIDENDVLTILQSRPLPPATEASPPAEGNGGVPLLTGGITASAGAASGPAFVATKAADMLKFPPGAVLVTRQPLPLWAPVASQAAAVITEEGGFAGHLAHIAREFGIPALFSLPEATKRITDGTVITVDGAARAVYAGSRAPARRPAAKSAPMIRFHDSPVYGTLTVVSRHIVPLHLLDPDALTFRSDNCKTFHDITRFVHEKAMTEMFSFGKDHRFPEKSGKQLVDRVPMQWWVLNLDDGFRIEPTGNRIRLEDITAIPMLALWEGITAIPWEGPPPVDGKGLLSVMFQSTTNRALTPGVRSSYANRNYFMISKHYCSLSTRLGYHFALIEAMVGDRQAENYASFQFKGGAADFDRRLGRVNLIREILQEEGFRVDIRQDTLIARIERLPADEMRRHLKTLGYLVIHTRQIDMVMGNPASAAYYREKLGKDILKLGNATG